MLTVFIGHFKRVIVVTWSNMRKSYYCLQLGMHEVMVFYQSDCEIEPMTAMDKHLFYAINHINSNVIEELIITTLWK